MIFRPLTVVGTSPNDPVVLGAMRCSTMRLVLLTVLSAGLLGCNEHTALNATAKIDLQPAATAPTTVELIVAGLQVIGPDGQRIGPAGAVTLLPADTQRVALKVCKDTPYATVTQALRSLQARQLPVAVANADAARCG